MKYLSYPKLIFLGGISLLFISLFMEWYSFQVGDINNHIIASWSYNLFSEWTTEFPKGITINEDYKPPNLSVPLIIDILFFVVLILVVGVILIGDNMGSNEKSFSRYYSYIFLFLLALNFFYIVLFPTLYLFPNQLYYPVLTNVDTELNITFYYSIGTGYVLQLFGFIFVFPYSINYIITITLLERTKYIPEIQIENVIQKVQESLDLDQVIAEEELRIKEGEYS